MITMYNDRTRSSSGRIIKNNFVNSLRYKLEIEKEFFFSLTLSLKDLISSFFLNKL